MGSGSIATPTVAPTPTAAATIVPVPIVTLPDDGGLPWCLWLLLLLLLIVVAGIIAYWRRRQRERRWYLRRWPIVIADYARRRATTGIWRWVPER